jgi:hypothetical protein
MKTLDNMYNLSKSIIKNIQDSYNNLVVEFLIGDEVYYIHNDGNIVKAIIDKIENPRTSGDLVYYWIIPENAKIRIYDKLKFWLCTNLGINYSPPKNFPGHSVLSGDDFFRTKEEAELMLILSDINSIIERMEKDEI